MISVVVLTHNDESVLERSVKSLQWCDEVIVVDDQSTDGTIGIAKKLGAKVFVHSLNDDFAAQRNFGLAKAGGPASTRGASSTRGGEWVLFVDSDEVVTEDLKREIIQTVNGKRLPAGEAGQTVNGYFICRKDYWGGRWLEHGETGNIKLLRLGRIDAGKWEQSVHEEWKITGNVKTLANPLLHHPHQNVAQFLDEINRYSGVYAQYLHLQGIKEPTWQIVGKPLAKFFVNYIRRLGFLDGTAGITVALMMSFHSFLVRAKLWHLQHKSL